MLEFASARNDTVNSDAAMREALDATSGALGEADLVILHTTMGHDFQTLLDAAKAHSPNADVVGCTCHGVIGVDGISERMRALAIMTVKGREHFAVAHASTLRERIARYGLKPQGT